MSVEFGFERKKIKDLILEYASGPSPTSDERQVASAEEWGLLKTTAVTWGGWNPSAHKVPPKEYWGNKRLEVKKGDVLITKAGPRNRCGVVVYVDQTPPRLMVSGKMIGLRPDPERVHYKVLAGALSQHEPQRFLDSRTTGMADAQLNFTNDLLLNTEVMLPPKAEQHKIAEIISTLSMAIEQTEALIAKQQRIKIGLMQDIFAYGIDQQGNLRFEETHSFKDSSLGRIPARWTVKRLAECVEFWDGQRVPLKQGDRDQIPGDIPYYGASGIIDYIDKYLFDDDLILIGEDGENVVSRNLPLAFKVTGQVWVNNHAHVLKPKDGFDIDFLTERLEFSDYALLVSGSAQPKLNQRNLRQLELPMPPSSEQKRLGEVLVAQADRTNQLVRKLKKLRGITSGLMQDLLTGEKRVTSLLDPAEAA